MVRIHPGPLRNKMSDQTLNKYIKQNLAAGFAENEIREELLRAGWQGSDITDSFRTIKNQSAPFQSKPANPNGFLQKHRRALIFILIILIVSPLLVYLSFLAYQRFGPAVKQTENKSSSLNAAADGAKTRDQNRLSDIQKLQTRLENYFNIQGAYPSSFAELGEPAPLDPKSKKPYVYSAFGDPALYYSLSFALETEMGPLKPGLQVATSESPLAVDNIQKQEEIVSGAVSQTVSEGLKITNLSAAPFTPQEQVTLAVDYPSGSDEIENVFLIIGKIKLVDRAKPFGFGFSAPKNPGIYTVQVFAFDKSGNVFYQETPLTVAP